MYCLCYEYAGKFYYQFDLKASSQVYALVPCRRGILEQVSWSLMDIWPKWQSSMLNHRCERINRCQGPYSSMRNRNENESIGIKIHNTDKLPYTCSLYVILLQDNLFSFLLDCFMGEKCWWCELSALQWAMNIYSEYSLMWFG